MRKAAFEHTFPRWQKLRLLLKLFAHYPAKARGVDVKIWRVRGWKVNRIVEHGIFDLPVSEACRDIQSGPIHREAEPTAHSPKIIQTVCLRWVEVIDRAVGIDICRLVAEPADVRL
jgi:hypothetical protein